nr:hypothetical protein [Tanacetum cinerariifolium]
SKTFCFNLEEISSGSTTTRSDYSLPDYEAFYDDHVKEISSGSTTTHSDFSLYDSFIFNLSINPFPPADRSDFYKFANELAHIISLPEYDCFSFKNEPNSGGFHYGCGGGYFTYPSHPSTESGFHSFKSDFYKFADELAHIISPSEYDCFSFKNEPNSGDFTMNVVEDTLPTHPTLQLNLDFILSSESLYDYVVWIFLPFLSYSVAPQYLLSFGNEDTIFDPGNSICHSFMSDVSHRSGTFMKFSVYPKHLNGSPMDTLFTTCSPMDQ